MIARRTPVKRSQRASLVSAWLGPCLHKSDRTCVWCQPSLHSHHKTRMFPDVRLQILSPSQKWLQWTPDSYHNCCTRSSCIRRSEVKSVQFRMRFPPSQFTVPMRYIFYLLRKTYKKVECKGTNLNPVNIVFHFPNVWNVKRLFYLYNIQLNSTILISHIFCGQFQMKGNFYTHVQSQ